MLRTELLLPVGYGPCVIQHDVPGYWAHPFIYDAGALLPWSRLVYQIIVWIRTELPVATAVAEQPKAWG